ncbi:MAG: tRNA threonylcarbamoyladenosine dehydratase [Lachnospiraceae bacterium]|nr:tRNA threonylcarbamoyladenosine dehydratase [Lachnospiraceae bacterium]
MSNEFIRTELLLGKEAIEMLKASHIAVFGIGGVGSFVVEALVRSGVGAIDIIDSDIVSESNINRQLYALHSSIGKYKVDVAEERILDINPDVNVKKNKTFFTRENANEFDFTKYDYIVDAIDTVTGKIELVMRAKEYNVPIISSMGAGNKLDPTKFEVSDIYKTKTCPLAKVMRNELKKRDIKKLKVVYSKEEPIKIKGGDEELNGENTKKRVPGSVSFVPSVAGLIIAGEVIKDLIKKC